MRISHGVATHGSALNVSTDLSFFEHVVPCGQPGRAATSLRQELGPGVEMADARDVWERHFRRLLRYGNVERVAPDQLAARLAEAKSRPQS